MPVTRQTVRLVCCCVFWLTTKSTATALAATHVANTNADTLINDWFGVNLMLGCDEVFHVASGLYFRS